VESASNEKCASICLCWFIDTKVSEKNTVSIFRGLPRSPHGLQLNHTRMSLSDIELQHGPGLSSSATQITKIFQYFPYLFNSPRSYRYFSTDTITSYSPNIFSNFGDEAGGHKNTRTDVTALCFTHWRLLYARKTLYSTAGKTIPWTAEYKHL
jgi:hypothetical protein